MAQKNSNDPMGDLFSQLSDMADAYFGKAKEAAEPYLIMARDAAEPYLIKAKEAAEPVIKGAKNAAEPVIRGARDKAEPVIKGARDSAARVTARLEVYVQYGDHELRTSDIAERCREDYARGKGKTEVVHDLQVYIKPEDNAVYYVVNGQDTGKITV